MNTISLENEFTSGVYGKRDVTIVRGQGVTVWDENGRAYLDCIAGIGVANVGHCHPHLAQAVAAQAQQLITCQEMFYNDQRARFLSRLSRRLPGQINRLYLCNSGAEAVEGAIKFARQSSDRTDVVAAMRGFHGRTYGALSATYKSQYRTPFTPLVPGFSHVPFGNLDKMRPAVTENTAAVILEVVQGEGGVRPESKAYFDGVRRLCDDYGALLVIDEVQTGYGRTGRFFACEHVDLEPDLICLGKAIAGGIPMGAVGLGPQVAGLTTGSHGSTFGGNPLACAAANAVLDIFENEQLVALAAANGAYFLDALQALEAPLIREVRGLGLMIGVELRQRAMPFVQALMDQGILALTAGPTVIRLLPPLTITRAEIDVVVGAIAGVLTANKEDSLQREPV